MSDKEAKNIKAASWKLSTDVLDMLKAIADHEGESQATVLRQLIKKDFKRLKLQLPSE